MVGRPHTRWLVIAVGVAAVSTLVAAGSAAPQGSAKGSSCQNTFIPVLGHEAEWLDPTRWTLGHVPLPSEAVCILGPGSFDAHLAGEGQASTVTLSSNETAGLLVDAGNEPCGNVSLTAPGGVTIGRHSFILLLSTCSADTLLDVDSSIIAVEAGGDLGFSGSPGVSTIAGSVDVNGGLAYTGGDRLAQIDGDLTLGSGGTFEPTLSPAAPAAAVAVSGTAALSGTVLPVLRGSPGLGETIRAVTAGAVTGRFTGERGVIARGEYFRFTYTQTEVDATVTIAKIQTPASARIGGDVVIIGSGFPAGDTVDFTLRDAAHSKFPLGAATADSSGAFTDDVTLPSSAAAGNATILAQSTFDTSLKTTRKLVLTG